jgi:hypothetical protein
MGIPELNIQLLGILKGKKTILVPIELGSKNNNSGQLLDTLINKKKTSRYFFADALRIFTPVNRKTITADTSCSL